MFILRLWLTLLVFYTFFILIIFFKYFWLFYFNLNQSINIARFKNIYYITKCITRPLDSLTLHVTKYKFIISLSNLKLFIKKILILSLLLSHNLVLVLKSWNSIIKKFLLLIFTFTHRVLQQLTLTKTARIIFVKYKQNFLTLSPPNQPKH